MAFQLPPPPFFEPSTENVAAEWLQWKKSFEYFITAIDAQEARKAAIFLHVAGKQVQMIYETLNPADEEKTYVQVLQLLDGYYNPKRNILYERTVFKSAKQEEGEKIDNFVTRLKKLVLHCEYNDPDDQVRDQMVQNCRDSGLRRRLLREREQTLDALVKVARIVEQSETQATKMEQMNERQYEAVNQIRRGSSYRQKDYLENTRKSTKVSVQQTACYRCGKPNHLARNCLVAKDKICSTCGFKGHLAVVCKTKRENYKKDSTSTGLKRDMKLMPPKSKSKYVHAVAPGTTDSGSDDDYIFGINQCTNKGTVAILKLHKKEVPFIIDSGATVNVINEETLKQVGISMTNVNPTSIRVFSYGNPQPIKLKGELFLNVCSHNTEARLPFVVIEGEYPCLIGEKAALQLSLFQYAGHIQYTTAEEEIVKPKNETCIEYNKYKSVFQGIGKAKGFQASVQLDPLVTPIAQRIRRTPFHLRQKIENEVKRLLDLGIIEEVKGPTPWISPIVPVIKNDGSVRICVDMRQPNKAVIKEKYPIPLVEDILQELDEATVYSELDFAMGYHQIEIDEQTRRITTFATESGVYRYTRLIFGLTVASEIYQHVIQQILKDCEGQKNLSDNVIVYGKDQAEHDQRLDKILKTIQESGMTLNKQKCKFRMNKLNFMGYLVTTKGIMLQDEKVRCIKEARAPRTVSELRSFMGLINFCGNFIPNQAQVTAPLRKLLKRGQQWEWEEPQLKAFQKLKDLISNKTVLAYFSKEKPTELMVDAGPDGLGAILIQEQDDQQKRPTAFASRSLTEQEKKYSQTEKEALAVIWACEKFHLFLYGKPFTILTDHKPLEVLYAPNSRPSARIERWVLRMQQYDFTIQYIKGENNYSDSLSRLLRPHKPDDTALSMIAEEHVAMIMTHAVPKAVTTEQLKTETAKDKTLQSVLKTLQQDHWKKQNNVFDKIRNDLTQYEGLLLKGDKIVIPVTMQQHILDLAHEGHLGIVKTKSLLRTKVWWPTMDRDIKSRIDGCIPCQSQATTEKPTPLVMTEMPEHPWKKLAVDICGPFPNGDSAFVLVDYHSRWVEIKLVKQTTTSVIISWLKDIFATHGFPEVILSDNGPQFISKEYKDFLSICGIQCKHTTPYWPQANGTVERVNRVFLKALRAAKIEGIPYKEALTTFLMAYRNTEHCTTGHTPSQLLMGRDIKTKIPTLQKWKEFKHSAHAQYKDKLNKNRNKQTSDAKRQAEEHEIQPRDKVLVQRRQKTNKLDTKLNSAPCDVLKVKGNWLRVKTTNGKHINVNVTHVKKINPSLQKTSSRVDQYSDDLDDIFLEEIGENVGADVRVNVENPERRPEMPRDVRSKRTIKQPGHLKDFIL